MFWAVNYNKQYKLRYHLSNLLLIFFDSLSALVSYMLGVIVDSGIKGQDMSLVVKLSVFLICFVIIKTIGSFVSVIFLDKTCFRITSDIKKDCYKKLNEVDRNFYQNNFQGEIMTLLTSDIRNIRRLISYTIKTVGFTVFHFIIGFTILLFIDVRLTLILLIPMPFILISALLMKRKTQKFYAQTRENLADLNNYIQDNIEGNKVVRSFAREENEISGMVLKNKKYKDCNIKNLNVRLIYGGFVEFFSGFLTLFLILFGGIFLIKGEITIGEFVIFQSLVWTLKEPFSRLPEILDAVQSYIISKKRIINLLEYEPKIVFNGTQKLNKLDSDIKFENVTVSFDEELVVKDINVVVPFGKTIGFIGPTGSGKSSIANLLLGFIKPSSGKIMIGDIDIEKIDLKTLKDKIGYVTQQPFLFSDTIRNNIAYGNDEITDEEIFEIIKIVKADFVYDLPDGIDTVIGERGVGLSGGEKQRLSLARALAAHPDLLILDDFTSALDIETEAFITESINEIKGTKIIIAQKIVSIKDADYIYVIDNHQVLECGTHEELLNNRKYYYEIYTIQNNSFSEVVK